MLLPNLPPEIINKINGYALELEMYDALKELRSGVNTELHQLKKMLNMDYTVSHEMPEDDNFYGWLSHTCFFDEGNYNRFPEDRLVLD